MPAPEETRASAQAEIDIGALYARLQEEVARTTGGSANWTELRDLAERYHALGTRRPLDRRPGVRGALAQPLKRLLDPALRWYVEPIVRDQRLFNDAALKLIDALAKRLDERA